MPSRKTKFMEARWNIVAMLCLVIAVMLWIKGYTDATLVVATLGVVAWFLNLRARFKVIRDEYEASRLSIEDARDAEVRVEENVGEKIERR